AAAGVGSSGFFPAWRGSPAASGAGDRGGGQVLLLRRRRHRQRRRGVCVDSRLRSRAAGTGDGGSARRPGRRACRRVPPRGAGSDCRAPSGPSRTSSGCGALSRAGPDGRRADRAHRPGQLRRRRARHPGAAGRVSDRTLGARASGDARRGGPSDGDRAGVCHRMGDSMMRKRPAVYRAAMLAAVVSGGSRASVPAASGSPTLKVTHWTDRTELYMEYPPLAAGRTALFAVHLTTLVDFTPVSAGRARVEFTPDTGGQSTTIEGPPPSRPGAFRVEGAPPAAGRYRRAPVLDSPRLSHRHHLGAGPVFPP